MAYKTILVSLNEIDRAPQLIAAACQLGIKFNAHISGLYVIPAVQIYSSGGYGAESFIYDGTQIYFQDHLPQVREKFETAMKLNALSYDLRVVESGLPNIASDVVSHSRIADLVLISDINRAPSENVEPDFVQHLVLAAGRPVLVLPFKGDAEIKFDDVMLGWNDSRESTRAAFDALPFMQRAKRTKIVTVDAAPRGSIEGANIAETLDRDGVKCEVVNVASAGMNVGETLLRAANDYGADLLVIGAYGHTRFTEWVMGGATRHVLLNIDRPVLLAH